MEFEKIYLQAQQACTELLKIAEYKSGDIFVIGCSTSEIVGKTIGTGSSVEAAQTVFDAVYPLITDAGLFLAVQCCEHLNRCLVIEREAAEKYDFTQVNVVPQLHAGGAFSMQACSRFYDHVMVEDIKGKAALGMDIGDTFIGMHLRSVVVPIHTDKKSVGDAHLSMARTRKKFVGGSRAVYD